MILYYENDHRSFLTITTVVNLPRTIKVDHMTCVQKPSEVTQYCSFAVTNGPKFKSVLTDNPSLQRVVNSAIESMR